VKPPLVASPTETLCCNAAIDLNTGIPASCAICAFGLHESNDIIKRGAQRQVHEFFLMNARSFFTTVDSQIVTVAASELARFQQRNRDSLEHSARRRRSIENQKALAARTAS